MALQHLSSEGPQLLQSGLKGSSKAGSVLRSLSPELGLQGQPGLTNIFMAHASW